MCFPRLPDCQHHHSGAHREGFLSVLPSSDATARYFDLVPSKTCPERLFSTLSLLKSLCHCFWHHRSHFQPNLSYFRSIFTFTHSISPRRRSSTSRHRFRTVSDPPLAFLTLEFPFSRFSPSTTAFSHFRTLVHSQAHRIAARKVPRRINFDFTQCTTFLVALFRPLHPYRVFSFSTAFSTFQALTRP